MAHNCGTNCTTNDYTNKNHNVMKRKTFYEAPETELILVKFEENIMSPVPGGAGDDEPIVEGPDFE